MTTTTKKAPPKVHPVAVKKAVSRKRARTISPRRLDAVADEAVLATRELLAEAIEESGIKHIELSERLGTTRSNVSQILGRGKGNPTIRMVSRWLYAMGYQLVIYFEPLDDTK